LNTDPLEGAVSDTEGGVFDPEPDVVAVTVRVADVVVAPLLSVATAFSVCDPAATLGHETL
jgi:hypothetical protein